MGEDQVYVTLQCPKCGFKHARSVPPDFRLWRELVIISVCPGYPGSYCGYSGWFGMRNPNVIPEGQEVV